MEFITLGKSDLKVSRLAIGTWQVSGWAGSNEEMQIKIIRKAIDSEINFIDTAESYGKGISEEVVRKAIEGQRKNLILASKFSHKNAKPEDTRKALEQSLRRLKTDYIDLYQYHWPAPEVPLKETIEIMKEFKREGKIRAIGVSNWMEPEWEEFEDTSEIDSLQNCYSLLWRSIEKEVLKFCKKRNVSVLAYSPLCQGILSGRFSNLSDIPKDPRKQNVVLTEENFPKIKKIIEVLRETAHKYGKTMSQVALRWLLDKEGVSAVICGATKLEQFEENLGVFNWSLEKEDIEILDDVSRDFSKDRDPHDTLWNWHPKNS
ncbi:MAG: aldo/keto reductase [bacterium]|nr:aldo/keto reductase [bacterium]